MKLYNLLDFAISKWYNVSILTVSTLTIFFGGDTFWRTVNLNL